MAGLYDDTPGLSDGTGLWRGRLGLFSGASGFINGGDGAAYIDLYFSAGTYSVSGSNYTTLGSIPGFTFTRASLAMGYDATGKLAYGPHNFATHSQAFDNAAWAKTGGSISADSAAAPDGTTTADTLIEDTSTGGHLLNRTITTGAASPICYSVYIKAGSGSRKYRLEWFDGGSYIWRGTFDPSNNTFSSITTPGLAYGSTSLGNGWYRVYMVAQPGATGASQQLFQYLVSGSSTSYTGDGTSGIYLWGAQLEAVTYQTTPSTYYPTTTAAYYGPRLVYNPVTLASQGILAEEARTNLCLQSQTFDNATWALNRATISANATTAPDGTATADKLVEDATASNTHRVLQAPITTAAVHTWSVYAKADTRSWFYLRLDRVGPTTPLAWFNVSNGTVGTVQTGFTASIQSVGSGWYRCTATVDTALAGANSIMIGLATADNVSSYTGDGTSGLFIWGAQLEAGTGASSPIPTTTASVTRAADVATVTGLAASYPLTMTTDFVRSWDAGAAQIVAQADAGSDAQRSYALIDASDLFAGITSGSGSSTVAGATVAGTAYKGAVRIAENDVQTARGGTLGTADTSATNPTNPTRLVIGGANAAGSPLNGTISRIRIYNRALSDAQLQSLTT